MTLRFSPTLLALALCAGCSTQPMTVRDSARLPGDGSTAPAAPMAPFCILEVRKLSDKRVDRSVLGTVKNRVVHSPDNAQDWLRNELQALAPRGVALQYGRATQDFALPKLQADVQLSEVAINSGKGSRVATVVMDFTYLRAGTPVSTATYRGMRSSPSLTSTDAAIQGTLDAAFDQVLDEVQLDVKRLCVAKPASR